MRQIFFCIIHKKKILSPEDEVLEATPLSVQSVQIDGFNISQLKRPDHYGIRIRHDHILLQ